MDEHCKSEVPLATTWEGRMRQIARCEFPYERALRIAVQCVEIAERYDSTQPQSMSPADPDAKSQNVVNLASKLECDVRLAVYSLYYNDRLVEHALAVQRLVTCGKQSDQPQ